MGPEVGQKWSRVGLGVLQVKAVRVRSQVNAVRVRVKNRVRVRNLVKLVRVWGGFLGLG